MSGDSRLDSRLAIVVVSHNTRDLLLECLSSVFESTRDVEIEAVVIDNASSDGSYDAVGRHYPQAKAIRNSANLGYGKACNQAIQATKSPFILLLNADARLSASALNALRDCMRSDLMCGAAGCATVNRDAAIAVNTWNFLSPVNQALEQLGLTSSLSCRYLRRSYSPRLDRENRDCSLDWIEGSCLLLRRKALDEVGLFDERFFMYSEDEDLCFRLKRRGWSICFSGVGVVTHHGGASTSQHGAEMLRHFYASQLFFLSKHRGSIAVAFYIASMTGALILKRLLSDPVAKAERRKDATDRLLALRLASSTKF